MWIIKVKQAPSKTSREYLIANSASLVCFLNQVVTGLFVGPIYISGQSEQTILYAPLISSTVFRSFSQSSLLEKKG